jgi:hypothetical protein
MRKFIKNGISAVPLVARPVTTVPFFKLLEKISKRKKVVLVLVGMTLVAMVLILSRSKPSSMQSSKQSGNQTVQTPTSKALQKIDKTFIFSFDNSKFAYVIESAELQDEIILKGQVATAVKGKSFLILNIKIRNDNKVAFEINTRDFIRLTVNSTNDKLAADIHNDPVLVQAISTKPTRLGFPIKNTDEHLVLYVGEIEGKKQEIVINF